MFIENGPAKFTAEMYGTKVTIELNHSDLDITELLEVFKGLTLASQFSESSWNRGIKNMAEEICEEELQNIKWDDVKVSMVQDEERYENLRHNTDEDYPGQFKDWENETPDDKDRYRATQEDEDEFDDYGQRIHPTFEWGDEPENENDDDWFNEEQYQPNEVLKAGAEEYKKKMKAVPKTTKTKTNDNKKKKRNTKG